MATDDPFAGIAPAPGALGGSNLDSSGPVDPRPAGPGYGGVMDLTNVQAGSLGGDDEEVGLSADEEARLEHLLSETAPEPEATPELPLPPTEPEHGSMPGSEPATTVPGSSEPTPGSESGSMTSSVPAEEPAPPVAAGAAEKGNNQFRDYFVLAESVLDNDEPYWYKLATVSARTHERALRKYLRDNGITPDNTPTQKWVVVSVRDWRTLQPVARVTYEVGEV